MLRSGVTDGCQVTVMSAPCSCGVFTSTFSRRSRNTHVSFTPGRSTPVSPRDVLRGEECVEDRLGEVVEVEGRSSQILWSHSEDHLDGELGSQGRRSEWGLRIGGRHGVAYGLPPADGLAARWVSTHLNPPRVRVIIATLVNRHFSLPGESASELAVIGACRVFGPLLLLRVPHAYGLAERKTQNRYFVNGCCSGRTALAVPEPPRTTEERRIISLPMQSGRLSGSISLRQPRSAWIEWRPVLADA